MQAAVSLPAHVKMDVMRRPHMAKRLGRLRRRPSPSKSTLSEVRSRSTYPDDAPDASPRFPLRLVSRRGVRRRLR